ncbi:G-type lectin S-receptor-like serine/threonine-protein kinase At4g27290 isoform X1 [Lotus japonicus]|uniref:G-type lectin S-receptor-like serine/threonine-protein kinase At4g27290 isoform X1 n=1 Tax=Lotus japonicus TaxID=34305 RepID=UPI00258DFE68|nr:G-type lectin S-receptor-like serine/threonine-protein kinase At4g27290 isoform X1 [Lotus japonicus]
MRFIITLTYILLLLPYKLSIAADSIHLSQSITDGQTLVSQDETFELGFFRPDGNSNRTYLGIWFKNIPVRQVVWVANRVKPIIGSDRIMLTVNRTGNLVLTQNSTVVWFTNIQKQAHTNPVAVLLDNGNLVVRNVGETNQEEHLWQSFDYPSDTWLPHMKVGRSFKSGHDWKLTSWKSPEDPSPSDFTWGLALRDYPDSYIMKGTKIKLSRFGPWNGEYPSGAPEVRYTTSSSTRLLGNRYEFVVNKDEMFYRYTQNKSSVISIIVLKQSTLFPYVWIEQEQIWKTYRSFPRDYCDTYGLCGAYGNCVISRGDMCQCFKGFSPKSLAITDWSEGCVRDEPLSCYNGTQKDGFIKFGGLRVPDTTHALLNESISLEECRDKCLNNCSCMAYTNSNISGGGSGCVMWFGDLIDIRQFDNGGQDLYIRMPASMLGTDHGSERRIIIHITIASICGLLVPCLYFVWRFRRKIVAETSQLAEIDLPLFDLTTIAAATNGFSMNKKIGEGGFGPVYWGKLTNGQEIAVKKLSSLSSQGMTEFINEVKLIAQLQHRNLVKLLGCCIQGQERVLIYEYMNNGSLHSFIFDDIKGKLLKWPQRLHIICGVCRGLLYLHRDSRLRIIHRDLKASNVLLDQDLNPKISDFGTARTFGGDQTEGNTKRIIGTYGYMAPEYVSKGIFSVKSDVFSFGVLLLEIICGKRNKAYYHTDDNLNLVGQAWTLWKEGIASELIDSNIGDSYVVSEVLRCMHVSLLCVQQNPNDRPTMTSAMLMLESEMELEEPKEPGFFYSNISLDSYLRSSRKDRSLAYDVTISSFGPR